MYIFSIYVIIIFFIAILSSVFRQYDRIFAILIGLVIVIFAGLRGGGHDYNNYLNHVSLYRDLADTNIFDKISSAKDPMFSFFIELSSLISNSVELPIVFMVLISILGKLWFNELYITRKSKLIAYYGIFIAPGLEFAAIRAGLGLTFFIFFIAYKFSLKKISIGILTLLSHVQYLPLLIGSFIIGKKPLKLTLTISLTISVFIYIILLNINYLTYDRLLDYHDNRGTIYAIFPPLAVLAILFISFPETLIQNNKQPNCYVFNRRLKNASIVCLLISFSSCFTVVTMSGRILEVAYYLMLTLYYNTPYLNRKLIGFVLFTGYLIYINYYRGTWVVFDEFNII